MLVNELYLNGSNSGRIWVQASFSRPGRADSRTCHSASTAAGVIPMAGEISTRLAGAGAPVPPKTLSAWSSANGAPVE